MEVSAGASFGAGAVMMHAPLPIFGSERAGAAMMHALGPRAMEERGCGFALGCEYQICVLCPVSCGDHAACNLQTAPKCLRYAAAASDVRGAYGRVSGMCVGVVKQGVYRLPASIANNSKPGENLKQLTGTPPVHSRFTGKVFISTPEFHTAVLRRTQSRQAPPNRRPI